MAANIINERRGWVQSEEIGIRHRQEISDSCMVILRTMDEFSWQRYEMELVKQGYKVHLQEKTVAEFMAIPSSVATPFINHPCWVLVET